jgi:hypothetical protein
MWILYCFIVICFVFKGFVIVIDCLSHFLFSSTACERRHWKHVLPIARALASSSSLRSSTGAEIEV